MPLIKPISEIDDHPSSVPDVLPKKVGKLVFKEGAKVLARLEKYDVPAEPTEVYIENQSGRYIKRLEALVDLASELGQIETESAILFGLLKMTKLGRTKTDVVVSGGVSKLREEGNMKSFTDEELAALAAKAKINA